MLKTNEDRLAKFKLQGLVAPMYGGGWEICYDGKTRRIPSLGGITLNFKVGDLVNRYVADHLEPGVSTSMEPDLDSGKTRSMRNQGYNTYSCIGNEAIIISGPAKGKKGRVTGHHGGCEHVLIDFDDGTLDKLTYDDKIMITAFGCGLELQGVDDVTVFSLDPALLKKMKVRLVGSSLEIGVTTIIPAVVMGSGIGGSDPYKGDFDIQTSDSATNEKHGLNRLRIGDIVAIADHDSTQGWSYRQGAVSIGVVIHGDSWLAGHGPGCQTILTSANGHIIPKIDPAANIGNYLKIGRYRAKRT